MTTTTQNGQARCAFYRWPCDPERRVYETLTDEQAEALTAGQLREAIGGSLTIMRDSITGQLNVFDASAMALAVAE